MSPILVRPVREQLEHDRVIRLLQAKYKRKFDVAINPGNEQSMPVGNGPSPWYPDLVLQTSDKARKLAAIIEVETVESVNNLEAMSEWVTFGRLRVPFLLYLPAVSIDTGRRFCTELDVPVAELWAYQLVGDQLRFTLVHRNGPPLEGKTRASSDEPDDQPAKRPAADAIKRPAPVGAPPKIDKADTPRAAKPETARPAKVEAPRVAKAEAPRAAKAETPKAAKTEAPRPAKVETSRVAKAEAPRAVKPPAKVSPPAARPAAPATRARSTGTTAVPARRGAAAPAPRRPAAKAKAATPPRRPVVAKAAAPRRKVKPTPAPRAQKRK